jgi:DNA-binding IclR family transcriptional regulator
MTQGGVKPIASALKTLALLDLLGQSERPLRLAELTREGGESRATTYQKLVTLVNAGWVEQDEDRSYRLTLHAARMGEAALEQADLGERSTRILQQLVLDVGETASLAMMSGVHARLVKRMEAEVVLRVQRRVGTLLSLDNSASGRILTAYATAQYREMLEKKGAVLASATLLRDVARKGFAISTGKDVPGVQSIAVPVFDANGACVSALSIVAPVARFQGERYLRHLVRAADKLNALMSGTMNAVAGERAPGAKGGPTEGEISHKRSGPRTAAR